MTWSETRRRQDVLREVKAVAAVRQDGVLPWSDDYTDAYATPDELLRDLQYFWRITIEAQMDTRMGAADLEDRWDAIHRAYPGVVPILESHYLHSPLMRAHELKEATARLVA